VPQPSVLLLSDCIQHASYFLHFFKSTSLFKVRNYRELPLYVKTNFKTIDQKHNTADMRNLHIYINITSTPVIPIGVYSHRLIPLDCRATGG